MLQYLQHHQTEVEKKVNYRRIFDICHKKFPSDTQFIFFNYYNTSHFKPMGAYCCGQDRDIFHIDLLQIAIKQSQNQEYYSSLLSKDKKRQIKQLFFENSLSQIQQKYEQTIVKVMPIIEPSNSNIELSTNQLKKKLIVTKNQQSSLQSQTNIENKSSIIIQSGFIIYQNGYYQGDIVKNKQNGLGVYTILSSEIIIIKGQWQSGKFSKGNLFKKPQNGQNGSQQKLFYLQLKDGIKSAVVETEKFEYRGSIKLNIKSLNEMMTGEGTIYFKDKQSIYKGKIKNGLFHTQDREQSTFSINQERLKQMKFQGFYEKGFRQNLGTLAFDYDDLDYKLILNYRNGKPRGEGKIISGKNQTFIEANQILSEQTQNNLLHN